MEMQNTIFWLKVASGIVAGFGILGIAAALSGFTYINDFFIDLAFLPVDGKPADPGSESGLLWAIFNGLMVGWGVMMWQLSSQIYPREPVIAGRVLMTSIVSWFAVDSAGSVLVGAPFNVVLNCGFLLLFLVPLWRARQAQAA